MGVAMMAIAELNDDVVPTDGTATATDSSVGTAAEESNSAASSGSATATSMGGADDDMSRFAEEMAILNRTCSRNWDAMVKEAAAGQSGNKRKKKKNETKPKTKTINKKPDKAHKTTKKS